MDPYQEIERQNQLKRALEREKEREKKGGEREWVRGERGEKKGEEERGRRRREWGRSSPRKERGIPAGCHRGLSKDQEGLIKGKKGEGKKKEENEERKKGVGLPLMVTVDFLGFRVVAMCLLPISSDTIVYGSSDAGRTVISFFILLSSFVFFFLCLSFTFLLRRRY